MLRGYGILYSTDAVPRWYNTTGYRVTTVYCIHVRNGGSREAGGGSCTHPGPGPVEQGYHRRDLSLGCPMSGRLHGKFAVEFPEPITHSIALTDWHLDCRFAARLWLPCLVALAGCWLAAGVPLNKVCSAHSTYIHPPLASGQTQLLSQGIEYEVHMIVLCDYSVARPLQSPSSRIFRPLVFSNLYGRQPCPVVRRFASSTSCLLSGSASSS